MSRREHRETTESDKFPDDDWSQCEPGALNQVGRRQASLKNRRLFLKQAAIGSAVLVAGFATWSMFQDPKRITCDQAIAWIPLYLDKELSYDQTRQFEFHISKCNSCRRKLEAYQRQNSASV
ncbi:MAG: zf-HC2 domain-containing protein [Pirellulaceae bacterium]